MRVIVVLAEGFEEIEAITVVDVLRRAGIEVDMVGIVGTMVSGSHGIRVMADKRFGEIKTEGYDGIILPGGDPGYKNLAKTSKILEIIKKMYSEGKIVAAICAAPYVLAKAGILEGKKATIYPGMESELQYPRGEKVVVDGNVITSQGPGTAMEFALAIVEKLVGKEKAYLLRRQLIL
ncbi:MAG: DJ-1/PfpI family protein [Candidatus Aenigmatarchaeota archaeon]